MHRETRGPGATREVARPATAGGGPGHRTRGPSLKMVAAPASLGDPEGMQGLETNKLALPVLG